MKTHIKNTLFTLLILSLLIGIIKHPEASLNSAYNGLMTWFNIVVPSLFPFFIISEILIEIGFVKIIGNILKPIMYPLFRVSGESAFPFTMSIVSGYPVGVKISSNLRQKKLLSKYEAEKTISFSSTSGPLFMLGAVSIGILGSRKLAPLIMYPHYLGALTVGLIFRFYKIKECSTDKLNKNFSHISNNLNKNYSIGTVFSNSILNSINTILIVGGFIIFYSVFTEIIFLSNLFNKLIYFIDYLLPFNINIDLLKGFFAGLLEVTNGVKRISSINIHIVKKLILINFLIGWSGFSIHSQALSFISKTDISINLYIIAKFLHGIFASFYCYILYIFKYNQYIEPSFMPQTDTFNYYLTSQWSVIFMNSLKIAILTILYMLTTSIILITISKVLKRS